MCKMRRESQMDHREKLTFKELAKFKGSPQKTEKE